LVAQSFLHPASAVEYLNIFEDGLAGGFAGLIESPVYDFYLEDGEEAFAPRIVSRSADVGEAPPLSRNNTSENASIHI